VAADLAAARIRIAHNVAEIRLWIMAGDDLVRDLLDGGDPLTRWLDHLDAVPAEHRCAAIDRLISAAVTADDPAAEWCLQRDGLAAQVTVLAIGTGVEPL
jgi:hypothetical protein